MRFLIMLLVACCMLLASHAKAEDWPQVQFGPDHKGYTPDEPQPPYAMKWVAHLNEPTFPGAQPVIADGKVFIGTGWGNVIALDRNTGEEAWRVKTGAPVMGSPAVADGLVYVGSMDRHCYALKTADGEEVWTFETPAGISVAPVVADGKVFIAGRDGMARALKGDSGEQLWSLPVGGQVMATPAWHKGVLYVGGGDNCVYAIDAASGELKWKSDKLPGMAIRDYWLVATDDSVVVSTQLVYATHYTYEPLETEVMMPYMKANHGKLLVQKPVLEKTKAWLEERPDAQTLHILSAETGKPKAVPPVVQVHGGGCTGPLPAIGPDDMATQIYTLIRLRASGWAFAGQMDLDTGDIDPLIKGRYYMYTNHHEWRGPNEERMKNKSMFDRGFCVNDQSWGVSRGGDLAFFIRDPGWAASEGASSIINLKTGEDQHIVGEDWRKVRYELWNGSYGGAFHATAVPIAISDKQIFMKYIRNVIICFEGE